MTENAKTRPNAYFEMAPKQEHFFIHTFGSFQCIRFVKKHFFLSQTTGKGGGGGGGEGRNFRLCPLLGSQGNLTGPNWHIAHLNYDLYTTK